MWLNKAETWTLSDYYDHMPLIRDHTLTCVIQGHGCGECLVCQLHLKGLEYYLAHQEQLLANLRLKIERVLMLSKR